MSVACVMCGAPISNEVIMPRRRRDEYCCSRECEVERRKQAGFYKGISLKGHDARVEAVTKSNQVNPRRKRTK